ncbi:hypothetical protein L195_g016420 [Trifolium pratense]|uniref:Uncharacterized protein n=1 Tax=Trifolium pratense TaxID=57577 RepID=A0A2K3MRC8_TRIPR|nr:hypothetical protein L195_g016420 [Trifolium pratense]
MQSTVADVQTQLGQLSKLITNISKNNVVDAPTKEECKAVGKRVERIEKKNQEKEAIEFKIFKKWFKKMEITMEDAYRAFLNEMEELHEKELRSKLPLKLPDLGKFTIPCSINRVNIEKALLDLGSSINLMPLTLVKKYNMGQITISNKVELLMANKSIVNATGIIEDVLVKVNDLAFPVDFVVIDIDLADEKDIILGRPFLATSHVCIDMKLGELKIEMNDEVRTLKVYENSSYQCYRVKVRDKNLEDARPVSNQEWMDDGHEEEKS